MTARRKVSVDTGPAAEAPQPTYGFGRQSRGSRKGLGGDPPNAAVDRLRPRRAEETVEDQISETENEDQGKKQPGS